MIYLRTGKPGASKTLNSLKELVESHEPEREYYYHNIRLLMLDMDVAQSFSGWFYGWYLPRLKDKSQKRKVERLLRRIHDDDEFARLDDFPWLESEFNQHNHFKTWLHWIKHVYPKNKLVALKMIVLIEL